MEDTDKKLAPDAKVPEDKKQDSNVVNIGDAVKAKSQDAGPGKTANKTSDAEKKPPARKGRPPKADKNEKTPKGKKQVLTSKNPANGKTATKTKAPEPEKPPEPREAPRTGEKEKIVYISLADLHPFDTFRSHPFQVRDDQEMRDTAKSVKEVGVQQPAIVRHRENGGYEIIAGHRRHKASELAGFTDMPCIVRDLNDFEAVQAMKDTNKQRSEILPSERAKLLDLELEAIKRQGARDSLTSGQVGPELKKGQRSNEIVAENNNMTVKQVQRYIKLNDLVPDLMKMVDDKVMKFTPAVELAFISKPNQRYIAVAIEGQQAAPSLSQAQRMRQLDEKKMLNPDVIDGIMTEEKKEVDKVIISTQELNQYFGEEKTPRQMKDQIMALLDEWKGQQKEKPAPEKQAEADR